MQRLASVVRQRSSSRPCCLVVYVRSSGLAWLHVRCCFQSIVAFLLPPLSSPHHHSIVVEWVAAWQKMQRQKWSMAHDPRCILLLVRYYQICCSSHPILSNAVRVADDEVGRNAFQHPCWSNGDENDDEQHRTVMVALEVWNPVTVLDGSFLMSEGGSLSQRCATYGPNPAQLPDWSRCAA